jgi:hypothetical protein
MHEYREKIKSDSGQVRPSQVASAIAVQRPEQDSWMDLAAQYGLSSMMPSKSHQGDQTVDQEYQAYVTAQLADSNILQYWQVSGHFNGA